MSKKIKIMIVEEPEHGPHKAKFSDKIKGAGRKVKEKTAKALAWCSDNEEVIVETLTTVTGLVAAGWVLKKRYGPTAQERERKRIDTTYYDPRTGLHWQLKRKLTNRERDELERRLSDGERAGDVLNDMRVLR